MTTAKSTAQSCETYERLNLCTNNLLMATAKTLHCDKQVHAWTHLAGVRVECHIGYAYRCWAPLKVSTHQACEWLTRGRLSGEEDYAVYVMTAPKATTLFRLSKQSGRWFAFFVLPPAHSQGDAQFVVAMLNPANCSPHDIPTLTRDATVISDNAGITEGVFIEAVP